MAPSNNFSSEYLYDVLMLVQTTSKSVPPSLRALTHTLTCDICITMMAHSVLGENYTHMKGKMVKRNFNVGYVHSTFHFSHS